MQTVRVSQTDAAEPGRVGATLTRHQRTKQTSGQRRRSNKAVPQSPAVWRHIAGETVKETTLSDCRCWHEVAKAFRGQPRLGVSIHDYLIFMPRKSLAAIMCASAPKFSQLGGARIKSASVSQVRSVFVWIFLWQMCCCSPILPRNITERALRFANFKTYLAWKTKNGKRSNIGFAPAVQVASMPATPGLQCARLQAWSHWRESQLTGMEEVLPFPWPLIRQSRAIGWKAQIPIDFQCNSTGSRTIRQPTWEARAPPTWLSCHTGFDTEQNVLRNVAKLRSKAIFKQFDDFASVSWANCQLREDLLHWESSTARWSAAHYVSENNAIQCLNFFV